MPVFPTDVSRHVMYSLPKPSESERPFSPLAAGPKSWFCRHWAGGGEAPNGTEWIAYASAMGAIAIGRGGHMIQKAQYHWPWAVGVGVVGTVGRRDWNWEWRGGGWHIFYRRPVPTSITLAFFKSMHSAHSPCGIKRPTISRFWSFNLKNKHIKDVFCLEWLINSES